MIEISLKLAKIYHNKKRLDTASCYSRGCMSIFMLPVLSDYVDTMKQKWDLIGV